MSDQPGQDHPSVGPESPEGVSRRSFLQLGTAGTGALVAGLASTVPALALTPRPHREVEETSIAELQEMLTQGQIDEVELVDAFLERIEAIDSGPEGLRSILRVASLARHRAELMRAERRTSGPRGPLHGIPIVVKDTIDTRFLPTSAGSLALAGVAADRSATSFSRLMHAGAILLGKTGLSEWSNFRGFSSTSGWSAVGGQVRNPYILDRNPCGSSSGTAAAVSASLAAGGLGLETDGSIVCSAGACGVVGIKPTVGLTSRFRTVPISPTQDSLGTVGRTVADAAAMLGPMTGRDPDDPATSASEGHAFTDYTQFLDPEGLAGARIGVDFQLAGTGRRLTDEAFAAALAAMESAGAVIVEVAIPTLGEFLNDPSEIVILVYELKRALAEYLALRPGLPVSSLAELIAFNLEHADEELRFFGQEWFELSELEIFSEAEYLAALETGPRLAGADGLFATLDAGGLDALVAPTNTPAWPSDPVNGDAFLYGSSSLAAVAGSPLVSVPAGSAFGLPLGITFMGRRWSEPTLVGLASGFETVVGARRPPEYLPTLPEDAARAAPRRVPRREDLLHRLGGRALRRPPMV